MEGGHGVWKGLEGREAFNLGENFMDRQKRRVNGNIEKCQKQWDSHMWELNEGGNEFGLAARMNHDLRNECVNSSEEEFECKNVWLGDTGASAHMSMMQSVSGH